MKAPVKTPVTDKGLHQFDHLPAAEAVVAAWTTSGTYPSWHKAAKRQVRAAMPVLVRALERLEREEE